MLPVARSESVRRKEDRHPPTGRYPGHGPDGTAEARTAYGPTATGQAREHGTRRTPRPPGV